MTELDTTFYDQNGHVIHPVIKNTAKDGSGTWYVPLVNSDGRPEVVRAKAGLSSTGVKTADYQVKGSAGEVYWLSVSDTSAGVVGLADSTSNSTVYKWKTTIPADGYAHFIFDPPLEFSTGIWLDIPTGSPDVIVGYI